MSLFGLINRICPVVIFLLQPWIFHGVVRLELLVILCCMFFSVNSSSVFSNINLHYLYISISLIVFVLIITVVNGEFQIAYANLFTKLFIIFWGAYILTYTLNINTDMLLVSLRVAVSFSLLFYILCVNFLPFRDLALFLKAETYGLENKLEVYRLWFPTSAHTFHLGLFFFTVSCLQILYKERWYWLILTVACAFISSRSAMLFSLVFIFIDSLIRNWKNLISIILVILFLVVFIANYADDDSVSYALEPIIKLMDSGELETNSSDDLIQNHLYFPEDKYFLFGSGLYFNDDGSFFGHTDSGLIRPLLYGGLVFQILYVLIIFIFSIVLFEFGFIGLLMFLSFLVLNVKAEFLMPSPHMALLSMLFWINRKLSHN